MRERRRTRLLQATLLAAGVGSVHADVDVLLRAQDLGSGVLPSLVLLPQGETLDVFALRRSVAGGTGTLLRVTVAGNRIVGVEPFALGTLSDLLTRLQPNLAYSAVAIPAETPFVLPHPNQLASDALETPGALALVLPEPHLVPAVNLATIDSDGDGLSDADEMGLGGAPDRYDPGIDLDPLRADTDGDGLDDGEEVNVYGTLPLVADTDEDGINDGDEVLAGTDPLLADVPGAQVPLPTWALLGLLPAIALYRGRRQRHGRLSAKAC